MEHFLDHDACCIHCGLDACDFPRGEKLPPCPVWSEEQRAANVAAWQADAETRWEGVADPDVPFDDEPFDEQAFLEDDAHMRRTAI